MDYEPYVDLVALPDLSVFQFISDGTRERITKQIHFIPIDVPGTYILQLGDITEYGGFDRSMVSNNGDRNRILATVVLAIEAYMERYPDRSVLIGSIFAERTRLFRMAIGANIRQLSGSFTIRIVGDEDFLFIRKDKKSVDFRLRHTKSVNNTISASLEIKSRLFKRSVSVQLSNELNKGFSMSGDKNPWIGHMQSRGMTRASLRIKKPALAGRVSDSKIQ